MSIVSMTSRWASSSEAGSELVLEQNKSSATGIKAGIRKVSAFWPLANTPITDEEVYKTLIFGKIEIWLFFKSTK